MILNIKCEGIEFKILELLQKFNISNYFFLDSSFPMIVKMVKMGISNIAIRFSEYESIETLHHFKNKVDWVWIDCFTRLPLTNEIMQKLKGLEYKTYLVSPDLVGRPKDIENYANQMIKLGYDVQAICTKVNQIGKWSSLYK